ncbi:MAG: hypothetical protein HW405_244 [Candidatus Berkelbacteria bacterium]|nr:hypothetical protein [Candidatus Berkelbacteria bacterium]
MGKGKKISKNYSNFSTSLEINKKPPRSDAEACTRKGLGCGFAAGDGKGNGGPGDGLAGVDSLAAGAAAFFLDLDRGQEIQVALARDWSEELGVFDAGKPEDLFG